MGVKKFRHSGPFTHPLSSSPSADYGVDNVTSAVTRSMSVQ